MGISPVGHSWEELRDEFLTSEERAECGRAVAALGELLDALGRDYHARGVRRRL